MDPQKQKELAIHRRKGWDALFTKFEKLSDENGDLVYSESELTDNDSYSESDEEIDEESDTINSIDECDEAPEDEPIDKVLHDIDPSMFLQQFRTMCQRKMKTWENYREHEIFECTETNDKCKKRRESIVNSSKGTFQEENISSCGFLRTPLKSDMKALAIKPAAKYFGTPNRQIQNQSKDWEKSRKHKTTDTTISAGSTEKEINIQSMQQFGQKMRKYIAEDAKSLNDDKTKELITVSTNKVINSEAEEYCETVTTTTTTTTIKKIRRRSILSSATTPSNSITISSSDDSEPCLPGKKCKVNKRYNIDSDECPITPKKQLASSHMDCSKMGSSIVVATPSQSTIISKNTIQKRYLAKFANEDIDISHFRDVRVSENETLKIILPKTPRSSCTPLERSKLRAIDQKPHMELDKERDILSTITDSPISKKPIIAREK